MAGAQAQIRLVHKRNDHYPEPDKETLRPFRIWNPKTNAFVLGRWYVSEFRAINQAYVFAKYYVPLGESVEVLDVRKAKWLATYTKKIGKDGRAWVAYEQYDTDEAILARSERS